MMQQMLLGSAGGSLLQPQSMTVSDIGSSGTISAALNFGSNGQQFTTRGSSNTVLNNWVIPTDTADEWEIRAQLVSGDTPTTGSINTWESLGSVNRTWSLSRSAIGTSSCNLTFEFRPVGGSSPTETITGNTITVEKLDLF